MYNQSLPKVAWWFAKEDKLPHGDNRKVIVGETLSVEPPLKLCCHGLHWSIEPLDALIYAPDYLLYKVQPLGEFILGRDKGCSTQRKALAVHNVKDLLIKFAKREVLSVIHLWKYVPQVILDYLNSETNELAEEVRKAKPTDGVDYHTTMIATAVISATNFDRDPYFAFSTASYVAEIIVYTKGEKYPVVIRQSRLKFNRMIYDLFNSSK